MASNEVRALGELAADTVDVTVTTPVKGLHQAVARRVFRAVGPASEPTRVVHDGIASAVYGALRLAGEAAGSAAGRAAEALSGEEDVRGHGLGAPRASVRGAGRRPAGAPRERHGPG